MILLTVFTLQTVNAIKSSQTFGDEQEMRKIRFLFYYLGKVITVNARLQQTENPLDLKWRWKYWRRKDDRRRERKALYELNKPSHWRRRIQ